MTKQVSIAFLFLSALISTLAAQPAFSDARLNGTPAEHEVLGNPFYAITGVAPELDHLIERDQYVLSYNRNNGIPNWVAWHLDSSWLGSTPRQDDYRPDTGLPVGWYQVQANDYVGSGFDRAQMCPADDRTSSVADNSATFLMTNVLPMAPSIYQGRWTDLENYCRTLVSEGNELYIYSGSFGCGGIGSNGGSTCQIAFGHVVAPNRLWKVIVVLPEGTNDADRITKSTRIIAVIMRNADFVTGEWRDFRVNVAQVETLTALRFFGNARRSIQRIIKLKKDTL